jgi:resuscitation-promoting factor RpfB
MVRGTGLKVAACIGVLAAVMSQGSGSTSTALSSASSGGSAQSYAATLVGDPAQMQCLDALWTQESSWNPGAVNPSSGAYGIPQANPTYTGGEWGAYSAGDPQAQVRWGLAYIKERYGSPCAAEQHEQADGWY